MGLRERDAGFATPVEMMAVLFFAVLAVVFLGFLGRLHAAGVQVTEVAQSAARAASLEVTPAAARTAAVRTVAGSELTARCVGRPTTKLTWQPSSIGSWQGGSVTVRISCRVTSQSLAGLWAPGTRTVSMSDTQPVDRYHR
jgi:hypothetical protein